MKYLLDTCVISELIRRQPNQRVVDWIDSVDAAHLYLSVVTIGEIQKGIEKLAESPRKAELHEWLHQLDPPPSRPSIRKAASRCRSSTTSW